MTEFSNFFKRSEFACKCGCGFDTVDSELLTTLEIVRSHFDAPVTITSGSRCVKHNRKVGGAKESQHIYGRAADFIVKDVHADDVADFLELNNQHQFGIGRYNGRTHIDTKSGPARAWDKR